MESDVLRIFAAVARAGNITRAAQELNTVQSNVTTRIRALEEELGVKLLNRLTRGVTLTQAGEQLLPYALQIEGLLSEAKENVAGIPGVVRGRLRIGSLETTVGVRLPDVVARFGTRHPDVDLSLITGTTQSLLEDVLAFRVEGAFVAGPVAGADLIGETIFSEQMTIVSSDSITDLRALLKPKSEVRIVLFRAGCSYRTRLEQILYSRGIQNVRCLEFGTLDGILGCVRAGLGITFLPKSVVESSRWRHTVRLHEPPADHARVDTIFIRRKDGYVSPALLSFLDCARDCGGKESRCGMSERHAAKNGASSTSKFKTTRLLHPAKACE
jgi:LysR family transcriptional regulator, cell division regulator